MGQEERVTGRNDRGASLKEKEKAERERATETETQRQREKPRGKLTEISENHRE